jgi:hydrogenase-4 component H
MNIFNLLTQNFSHKSRTRQPSDAVPYPRDFRGRLEHNTDLCTVCGTCVYACSPAAIQVSGMDEAEANWDYTEDRCTFCGFCVQYCPTHALTFAFESPVPITERSQHYTFHVMEQQPCRNCGKPSHALPLGSMEKIYGKPLPEEIAETIGLCEKCRRELTGKRFLKAVVVKGDRKDD